MKKGIRETLTTEKAAAAAKVKAAQVHYDEAKAAYEAAKAAVSEATSLKELEEQQGEMWKCEGAMDACSKDLIYEEGKLNGIEWLAQLIEWHLNSDELLGDLMDGPLSF